MDSETSNASMKKSPIYPKYEAGDYNDYGFDPQVDFSQFLEEARKHTSKENFEAAPPPCLGGAGKKHLGEAKTKKKSWKESLFSWWKDDKKSNSSVEPPTIPHTAKSKRGNASGPIYGSGGGASCKPRRPTSGPLTRFFHPTRRVENEMPYICLGQLNNTHDVQSYGPVYLVT
ncbi:uncharacterized protein LOC132285632 isoform X2 [Cornus florida]|uniref:uncharacterized protein LOC132285632 isoform X2 n=1 Tax=Cornus florida TaxID=4283 RepID=UPI002898F291|nr:uncharacterized protein LOC132285632 isoform X2 [Cornus florida]